MTLPRQKGSPGRSGELRSLTSLRFFAAFGVVLHHLQSFGFLQRDVYSLGSPAVVFFFVLSGFILTYSYHDKLVAKRGGWPAIRMFWVSRFARVYPVYLLTFAVAVPIVFATRPVEERRIESMLVGATMLQAYVPNLQVFFGFNGPSWSVAVEAFFYAMFPPLILASAWLCRGRRIVWPLLGVGCCVLLSLELPRYVLLHAPEAIRFWAFYVFPPYRTLEFASGIFLGLFFLHHRAWVERNLRMVLATTLEVAVIGLFAAQRLFNVFALPENVFTMLISLVAILVFATGNGLIARAISRRLTHYLGEISYSVYMWHYVIMMFLVLVIHVNVDDRRWPWAVIAITLALSSATYQLVERPARSRIRRAFYPLGAPRAGVDLLVAAQREELDQLRREVDLLRSAKAEAKELEPAPVA